MTQHTAAVHLEVSIAVASRGACPEPTRPKVWPKFRHGANEIDLCEEALRGGKMGSHWEKHLLVV